MGGQVYDNIHIIICAKSRLITDGASNCYTWMHCVIDGRSLCSEPIYIYIYMDAIPLIHDEDLIWKHGTLTNSEHI